LFGDLDSTIDCKQVFPVTEKQKCELNRIKASQKRKRTFDVSNQRAKRQHTISVVDTKVAAEMAEMAEAAVVLVAKAEAVKAVETVEVVEEMEFEQLL
jgi:hypothetical protein